MLKRDDPGYPGDAMIAVRPAVQGDISRIAGLEAIAPRMGRRVESSQGKKDAHVLVAERNDRLAGCAIVRIVQRGRGSLRRSRFRRLSSRLMPRADPKPESLVMPFRLGLLQDLYVVPSQRRQGVAAALLEGCERWLVSRDIKEIQASISLDDQAGHSFFQSQHFKPLRYLIERKL